MYGKAESSQYHRKACFWWKGGGGGEGACVGFIRAYRAYVGLTDQTEVNQSIS